MSNKRRHTVFADRLPNYLRLDFNLGATIITFDTQEIRQNIIIEQDCSQEIYRTSAGIATSKAIPQPYIIRAQITLEYDGTYNKFQQIKEIICAGKYNCEVSVFHEEITGGPTLTAPNVPVVYSGSVPVPTAKQPFLQVFQMYGVIELPETWYRIATGSGVDNSPVNIVIHETIQNGLSVPVPVSILDTTSEDLDTGIGGSGGEGTGG